MKKIYILESTKYGIYSMNGTDYFWEDTRVVGDSDCLQERKQVSGDGGGEDFYLYRTPNLF